MAFKRRQFLKTLLLLGPLFHTIEALAKKSLSQRSVSSIDLDTRLPIFQGATNGHSTQIHVMSTQALHFTVHTMENEKSQAIIDVKTTQQEGSSWISYLLVIENLSFKTAYHLHVKDGEGRIMDSRVFSTLDPNQKRFRVALASCMRDSKHVGGMWTALADSKPDLLCLLGDNVYVDDGPKKKEPISRQKIWRRYVETRTTLEFYKLPVLIPTIATWDDHDFGVNNSYGNQKWAGYSAEIFRNLYPQTEAMSEIVKGPGVATAFSAFGQRFFFMDDRTYRQIRYLGSHHWGIEQEEWLYDELAKNDKPAWIFNGSQFFGAYRRGWSFEDNHYPRFLKLLGKLKTFNCPVIFGSGDVHYSEVMQIEKSALGYETYEITSSSIHSNDKGVHRGNKRRIASTGKYNFVIADVRAIDGGMEMDVTSIGDKSEELFRLKDLKVTKA